MSYWKFEPEMLAQTYTFIRRPHYPIRRPPEKWPDLKLIGKAMARGWATPCRYFPRMWGRGGFYHDYIFPGISDAEYGFILAIMRGKETENGTL